MMQRILAIANYELREIQREIQLFGMLFLSGLLFALLFGAVYSQKVLVDIPMAIMDEDNTPMSREVIQDYDASNKFNVVCYVDTYKELKDLIDHDRVQAGLCIPRDFEKDTLKGKPTTVLTVFDASNLLYANNIRKAAQSVVLPLSATLGVKTLASQGILSSRALEILSAVSFRSETWYNPTIDYIRYLYLGLIILIAHQMCMVGASISFTRERESGVSLQFRLAPVSRLEVLIGKGLPYFLIGIFDYCLYLLIANKVFGLAIQGEPLLLLPFLAVLFLAVTGIGFCISLLCSNSLLPTRVVMASSIPLFMGSGFTWPLESMPLLIRWIMYCQPLTWMLRSARMILLKSAGILELWPYFLLLSLMAVLPWLVAYLLLGRDPSVSLGVHSWWKSPAAGYSSCAEQRS